VICLQNPIVFWMGGGTISPRYSMYTSLFDVKQTVIHIAEPLVPEPNAFEVELDI